MNTQIINCIHRSRRAKLGYLRPRRRLVESSYHLQRFLIRDGDEDGYPTVVEAQNLVEFDGRQDYEQSPMSITDYEGKLEDEGDVVFGTKTAASIVADAGRRIKVACCY